MLVLSLGWQALTPLFNWIAVIILACATYLIARKCGASRAAALLAVIILLSIPNLIQQQITSNLVDMYGASFIMAAVALFLYRNEPAPSETFDRSVLLLILSGLACGIAIGTKPIFSIHAAVFFVVGLAALAIERYRYGRSLVLPAILLLLAALVPSAFWYGRAFFATGNPFYPLEISLFGVTLFSGYCVDEITDPSYPLQFARTTADALIYLWRGSEFSNITRAGFGAIFATFVPPGVFYAIYTNLLSPKQNKFSAPTVLTLVFLAGLVVWWFVLLRIPRFGIALWALACILSCPLLDLFLRTRPRLFSGLLLGSLVITCFFSAYFPLHDFVTRVRAGDWSRSWWYGIPPLFDELPAGSVVLHLGNDFNNFGLAGERLSNIVISRFEAPRPLTGDFLRQRNVNYIVTRYQYPADDGYYFDEIAPLSGIQLELIYDESRWSDQLVEHPWKVWKVRHEPATAEPSLGSAHDGESAFGSEQQ
jgi:hypothetical protein